MSDFAFADFVQAVHGWRPFPWQERLAEQALTGTWPAAIDVPTGLGKTTVIDVAVYCLAASASEPPEQRVARTRTAFIVDRRVVVQGAFDHARRIAVALSDPRHEVTEWAARELRRIGAAADDELDHGHPLVVTQMRGGVTWDSRWVARPDQPAVVVGTVDQLGSRLLFRGYGVSDRMKPIDAGLLGTDTLLILDEAHLSGPLVETIRGITQLEGELAERPLDGRPLRTTTMTATPRLPLGEEGLVTDADREDPVAEPRLAAVKVARLIDVAHATTARANIELGRAIASTASDLVTRLDRSCGVVLVVANTIAMARGVHQHLREVRDAPFDVELVVGRCRAVEREANTTLWWDRAKAGREREAGARPLILVATQTVEVGADLDVDALVTEVAPIDALVQRFGRVDRLGALGETESFIFHAAGRLADDGPPYGEASARTWSWLINGATRAADDAEGQPRSSAPSVDFGPLALRERLDDAEQRAVLFSTPDQGPIILREIVAVWRRTAPIPDPDEGVASYLHGISRGSPSVAVAWRADVWAADQPDTEALTRNPPRPAELVEATVTSFRRFLRGAGPADRESDLESAPTEEDSLGPATTSTEPAHAVVRRGKSWEAITRASDVRPGDVIVVASGAGGHDQYGWTGQRGGSTIDVADLAALDRPTLRLDSRVLGLLCESENGDGIATGGSVPKLLAALRDGVEHAYRSSDGTAGDVNEPLDRCVHDFLSGLDAIAGGHLYGSMLRDLLAVLGGQSWSLTQGGTGAFVEIEVKDEDRDREDRIIQVRRLVGPEARPGRAIGAVRADDDDELQSSLISGDVTLAAHLDSVGRRADAIGLRLGLTVPLAAAVRLAGRFHDLGKADVRFQTVLRQGVRWLAEASGDDPDLLLAKSTPPVHARQPSASNGWPRRYRHEAVSLALVNAAPDDLFEGADRQLVAHLVASHHGHARPWFPPVADPHAAIVRVDFDGHVFEATPAGSHPAWDQPARFEQLCERYGTWGLALLEAVVRLADIAVSEEGG